MLFTIHRRTANRTSSTKSIIAVHIGFHKVQAYGTPHTNSLVSRKFHSLYLLFPTGTQSLDLKNYFGWVLGFPILSLLSFVPIFNKNEVGQTP